MLKKGTRNAMTITLVEGDPLLTDADMLAIGTNARGRSEQESLANDMHRAHPAAFASFGKQARQGRVSAGTYWVWYDSTPRLMFCAVRESSVGATRLRYIQAITLLIARDYRRENIKSLAIAPLGRPHEWDEIKKVLHTWLDQSALTVTVFDRYVPGQPPEKI